VHMIQTIYMTWLTDDLLLLFDLDDLVLQVVYDLRLGFHLLGDFQF